MNSCIHAGLRWLSISGIQHESGGVSGFFNTDTRGYLPVSTPATAHYVDSQLWSRRFTRGVLPAPAVRAGQFLVEHVFDSARELFAAAPKGTEDESVGLAYFVDCGVALRSLVHLSDATNDQGYLEYAERCGLAMHSRMNTVDGAFFPLYDLEADRAYEELGEWSGEMAVPQLKAGLAFLELYKATGRGEFEHDAEALRKWCLKRHESFLGGEVDDVKVVEQLHGYCDFLDGLLPGVALDTDSARVLQFGLLRVENLLDDIGDEYQRCDVMAQLLRLRMYADKLGVMELEYTRAEKEAATIAEFQVQSTDPRTDGGFVHARKRGQNLPQLDPTATALALQALEMWDQTEEGGLRDDWEVLV